MQPYWSGFAGFVAVSILCGAWTAHAQMPVVTLGAGIHIVRAEVANTNETRTQGLMFRRSLGPNDGMLFVFPRDEQYCMWMKNTLIPLSVAFIDVRGQIVSIHDMQPHSEQSHCATAPSRYALEMNSGWFRAKGVQRGTRLSGIDKAPAPR
jgi:uncharacterized membrane protein (UPF0127 family)